MTLLFKDHRYKARQQIGRGGHAVVYEAVDLDSTDGLRVAVKIMTLDGEHPQLTRLMFEREVEALDGFEHPHVVKLLDRFEEDGRFGLVLELVRGSVSLYTFIEEVNAGTRPRPDVKWRLDRLTELLGALAAAHERDVIHRDFKPKNILYDHDTGTFKVVDFGIARVLEQYGRGELEVTLRQFFTPPYAAPEQGEQAETSFATDLYAFGAVAIALLTFTNLSRSFESGMVKTCLRPLQDDLGAGHDHVYLSLEQLITRLLHRDAGGRPKYAEVNAVLRDASASLTSKLPVHMRLLEVARARLTEVSAEYSHYAAIVKDLNADLRVRYEERQDGGAYLLYGQKLFAVARSDWQHPEQLVIVTARLGTDRRFQSDREQGHIVPFRVEFGQGDATAFMRFVQDEHARAEHERHERRKRRDLFHVARALIEAQRRRLKRAVLQVTPVPYAYEDESLTEGQYLIVRVHSVAPEDKLAPLHDVVLEDNASDYDHGYESDLLEALDDQTMFSLNRESIGKFYSFDARRRLLVIELGKPRKKWPGSFALSAYNAAAEASLNRQEKALNQFTRSQTANPRLAELLVYPKSNVVTPHLEPQSLVQSSLQPKEEVAVLVGRILAARDVFVLQGPPGTGKTATITEVMAQILESNPDARILLTSQANEAVNNALEQLDEVRKVTGARWRLMRDVSTQRRGKDDTHGLDNVFSAWVRATRSRAITAFNAFKDTVPREHAEAVDLAVRKWVKLMDQVEDVRSDYADSVHVYGVTCMRIPALAKLLTNGTFDWVIVDEAAKATPAEVLVSLINGKRFLLVGDHKQLPPYIPQDARDDLLEQSITEEQMRESLFEYLFANISEGNRATLHRQYRMHRSIAQVVSAIAYTDLPGGLQTMVRDEDRELKLDRYNQDVRLFWIDVPFGKEEQREGSRSYFNDAEARAVRHELAAIDEEAQRHGVRYTVGVIAPYAQQISLLRNEIKPGPRQWKALEIDVDTVDAFQGKQKDIIVYSTTRTARRPWTFVGNEQRLNVALSRARRLVIVVGHREAAYLTPALAPVLSAVPPRNVFEGVMA